MSDKEKSKKKDYDRAFYPIFRRIRSLADFSSASVDGLPDRIFEAVATAASAKCVEFNLVAGRHVSKSVPSFILVSNLRGICEDLVVLSYLNKLPLRDSNEYLFKLFAQNTARGLDAQKNFFLRNNPYQPVVGINIPDDVLKGRITECRDDLRTFWSAQGSNKKDGPSIRDMAKDVGLLSTYEYIYFLASNFVHFNPQALFKTGWGPTSGPFTFSMNYLDGYYKIVSVCYGAVLFIGFNAAFGHIFKPRNFDRETNKLIDLINLAHRWPEIITFEEMNMNPPLYLLTNAFSKAMRQVDSTIPYAHILTEVQSLRVA